MNRECIFAALISSLLCGVITSMPAQDPAELDREVMRLYREGQYAEAIGVARKAVEMRRGNAEAEPAAYANSLNSLAGLYQLTGAYHESEPLYGEVIDIYATIAGKDHPSYATSLNNLGVLYQAMGDYAKAKPVHLEAKEIRARSLGKENPYYASSLHNLAEVNRALGAYGEAEPLFLEAIEVKEKIGGTESRDYALSVGGLARLYEVMGAYGKAEPLYRKSRDLRKSLFGSNHPSYASSLDSLAGVWQLMGRYEEAESLYREAQSIWAATVGEEHPSFATSVEGLGVVYRALGEFAKAEQQYQRARDIRRAIVGTEHPDYANSLHNLAELYRAMGAFDRAESLHLECRELRSTLLDSDHPDYAMSQHYLAELSQAMGDLEQAEALYREAIDIREKALGTDHPDYATSLNNLAGILKWRGAYEEAEQFYEQAIEIRARALGERHPDLATSLNNLAGLFRLTGEEEKASALYGRSQEIWGETVGPDHPYYASSLNNLAGMLCLQGALDEAGPLYEKAKAIRAKAFGTEHPAYCESIDNLALLYHATGRRDRAGELVRESIELQRTLLGRVFGAFPEEDRLRYTRSLGLHHLSCMLESGELAAASALAFKGAIGASLLEERRLLAASEDPVVARELAALQLLRRQFQQATLQGDGERAGGFLEEIETVEGRLARFVTGLGEARRALQVKTGEVQDRLLPGVVLVEMLRYRNLVFGEDGMGSWQECYGAAVIRREGVPLFVGLGPAESIDGAIAAMRKQVEEGGTDEETEALARELYERVLAPLEPALDDAATLLLCPDSQLHFLSFETLLDHDGKMACEKWNLRLVDSGRDLLEERDSKEVKSALLLGNPDFDEAASGGAETKATRTVHAELVDDLRGISFAALPGTADEIASLEKQMRAAGFETSQMSESGASEAALADQVAGRRVIHLATHGFFLQELPLRNEEVRMGEGESDAAAGVVRLQDPMLRSGLALAGASPTLETWQAGKAGDPSNDGILTAAEVVNLDLSASDLVVLSACETAKGRSLDGEGVYGLRRSLKMAGANSVVMTLWPVADAYTVEFMEAFYRRYLEGQHPAAALGETKREQLAKLKEDPELGFLDAIRLAGPFVATSQGQE